MKARSSTRRQIRSRLYLNGTRPTNPTAYLRLQGIAPALDTVARDHMEPDLPAAVLEKSLRRETGRPQSRRR
jgi:hypothetical protein